MGISLVTFAGQTVTPQDDALIYESALTSSGMIYGGAVTIKTANTLHVAAGHGALCGRKFTIEETDIPVSLTASGTLDGRVYIHMDLSDTDEPISFMVETAETLTPVVQDNNVNIVNGVYEINLATFTVDTSTLDNLVDVTPVIPSVPSLINGVYKSSDQTETLVDAADYIPFYDSSAGATKKIAQSNFLAVGTQGTASATSISYQYVKAGGTTYEIKGTKYMQQAKTVSTSADTTYTFSNAAITTASRIEVYADKFGINPSNIVVTSGQCVVTIPKQSSSYSLTLRIYIM
jgi:hypothetical protein